MERAEKSFFRDIYVDTSAFLCYSIIIRWTVHMEGYNYEYQLQQNVETADRQEHETERPERKGWG